MLWIKSFHLIAMVAWFAGLFYLPRLFVYHTELEENEQASLQRFQKMESRLYYYIMTPAALLTLAFGLWLFLYLWPYYMKAGWMHIKLTAVLVLCFFHLYCGYFVKQFKLGTKPKSQKFFRIFNEVPTFLLVLIVIMVVVKPI